MIVLTYISMFSLLRSLLIPVTSKVQSLWSKNNSKVLEISNFNTSTAVLRKQRSQQLHMDQMLLLFTAFRQVFVRTKQGQWNTLRGHRVQNQNTRIRERDMCRASNRLLASTDSLRGSSLGLRREMGEKLKRMLETFASCWAQQVHFEG